jgi:hypothetical protein
MRNLYLRRLGWALDRLLVVKRMTPAEEVAAFPEWWLIRRARRLDDDDDDDDDDDSDLASSLAG